MSNDPTPDQAGQVACRTCGETRGTIWNLSEAHGGSVCAGCLIPGVTCARCGAPPPLTRCEDLRYYYEACWPFAFGRWVGRIEMLRYLGVKPDRRRVIEGALYGHDLTAILPERRPGGGGRRHKYPPDVRDDLARRACVIVRNERGVFRRFHVPWRLRPQGVTHSGPPIASVRRSLKH